MYVRKVMPIGEFPPKIYRLNVRTGERVLWKELVAPDLAGFLFYSLLLTPDGRSYFYTYSRELSTLFLGRRPEVGRLIRARDFVFGGQNFASLKTAQARPGGRALAAI